MSQPFGLRLVAGTQMQRSKRPIRSTEGRLLAWLHIPRMGGDIPRRDWTTTTTTTLDGAEPGRLAQV